MPLDVLVLPAVFASQPQVSTGSRARIASDLRDVLPLFEAYHHHTSACYQQCLGHKAQQKTCPLPRMQKVCLNQMRLHFVYKKRMSFGQNLLLCVSGRIDYFLQILQGTFCNIDGEKQFCRLLLNHGDVVENSFVVGVYMESLGGGTRV